MTAEPCPSACAGGHECVLCRPVLARQQMVLYPDRALAISLAQLLVQRGSAVLRVGKLVRWWTS